MAEHTPVRDAPWKKRIDPRKVRGTYPFQRGAPNLQQRSWARCDEDYSCRYKTSCQNQLPQLQGGHESHKTFSKSTPHSCRGGRVPQNVLLEHPSSVSQSKSKKSNSKFNCKIKITKSKMFTRTKLKFNNSPSPSSRTSAGGR